ncbi:hypothetical protein [Frondihabitans sucicola]|uniref:hypothetical protein n=1 Tax=Frondihabitans sucicola TaxID=1268041 RepID=UPI002572B7FA|nr:hypothetical protein [Frondihabitans sucicola]
MSDPTQPHDNLDLVPLAGSERPAAPGVQPAATPSRATRRSRPRSSSVARIPSISTRSPPAPSMPPRTSETTAPTPKTSPSSRRRWREPA